jgi:hypothetical protein
VQANSSNIRLRRTATAVGGILAVFLLLGGITIASPERITSFEECAAAGYPVMESYPARCTTPVGTTFTQVVAGEFD